MKSGLFRTKGIYLKIFLVFSVCFFVITRFSRVPLIYPDEAGYIGWAYKMLYGTGDGLRYLPGYSVFLLLPLGLFKSITAAFPVITIVNSLLCGGFAALVYRFCVIIGGKYSLLITAAVSLYPAIGLNANLAMSESLIAPVFLLLVLGVYGLSKNINNFRLIMLCAVLSAYLCITHSRCIAILPALALALLPKVIKEGKRYIKALYFCVLSLGVAASVFLVVVLFMNRETVNAGHLLKQIIGLLSVEGFLSFAGTLVSQGSYLVISTLGFFAAGVYHTVKMYKKNRELSLFLLLSFGFTAVLSAVFMYHHENPAHILYGRYNEYTVFPIIAVGIAGFLEKGAKRHTVVVSVALCVVTAFVYGGSLAGLDMNITHTWGLYLYKLLFKSFSYVSVCIMFAVVAAVVLLLSKKSRQASVVALCVIFGITLVFAEYDYFVKGASPRQEYPQLARLLDGETAFDVRTESGNSMVYPWEYYNYTVYNPYLKNVKGADLVLSCESSEFALLGGEKYSDVKLYSVALDVSEGVDLSGKPEALVFAEAVDGKIRLNIENIGRPWLCTASADSITQAVRGGIRVYRDGDFVGELREDFKDNVYTSSSLEFEFPFEDGEYTIITETVREFKFRGGEAAYELVKQGDSISLSECDFEREETFWEFNPVSIPETTGFYKYYVTEGGAEIPGIYLDGDVVAIKTFGEGDGLSVDVFADGQKLELIKYEEDCYYYRLESPAESLRIESETYRFCDNSLSFLTTESNLRPVDWFVRGMKKLFDIRLDHRDYGVDIEKIKVYKEEL